MWQQIRRGQGRATGHVLIRCVAGVGWRVGEGSGQTVVSSTEVSRVPGIAEKPLKTAWRPWDLML